MALSRPIGWLRDQRGRRHARCLVDDGKNRRLNCRSFGSLGRGAGGGWAFAPESIVQKVERTIHLHVEFRVELRQLAHGALNRWVQNC